LGGDKTLPKVKGGSFGKVWVKVFEITDL